MNQDISRRYLLKGAATLMTVPALAQLAGAPAMAATERTPSPMAKYPRSGAFSSIDRILQRAVDERQVAGVVAVGATDNGIVYEGAFGKRDAAHGPAMSVDTVFWLLSMTKAVTATACMQLVEQGKLQLDDPVGKLMPELASPKVLEGFDASGAPRLRPARRPITLRHLLTHTSGLTYSNWSDKLPQYEKFTGLPDIAESKNGAFAAPLEFDPGERWQYGVGMDAVGKIIEAVQLLLLGRSGQESDRRSVHATAAVLRRADCRPLRCFRARHLHRLGESLSS